MNPSRGRKTEFTGQYKTHRKAKHNIVIGNKHKNKTDRGAMAIQGKPDKMLSAVPPALKNSSN